MSSLHAILGEFNGLAFGDERLDRRGVSIVKKVCLEPAKSFPEQMGSEGDLEALYRFIGNSRVNVEWLIEPHCKATVERIRGREVVRIIHDTSNFAFRGEREGLGILTGNTKGFLGHISLAVSADESREPLGVVGVHTYVHKETEQRRKLTVSQQARASLEKPRDEKESSRWEKRAIATATLMPEGVLAIHVMDQGVDYCALATLKQKGIAFVVRANPTRKTTTLDAKDVLASQPSSVFRTVRLTERKHYKNRPKKLPLRAEREAKLELRWGAVTIPRGYHVDHELDELQLNAVHVFEPSPPEGEEAIEWMLFTSEAVTCFEEAEAVVDHYRARWIIEEYFKALKTGCAIEKRQLTSLEALTTALALFVPIAWHLLLLRHLSRTAPSRSAHAIMDAEQLLLLRAMAEERRHKMPAEPSVRDVMLAIARIGGHIRNNGEPGWQVLGRGFVTFADAEAIWRLARRSDQS